jgi:hypothetical protein
MPGPIVKRYTFGNDNMYFYDFAIHTSVVPGGNPISTIMMSYTNVRNVPTSTIEEYIPGLVEFLANLCVEHGSSYDSASYDAYHNYLVPFSHQVSSNIADSVNALVQNMRSQPQP